MVNIIILPEEGHDHWPALGSKDIKLDVNDVWDRYIKKSDNYYVFKKLNGFDDIDPKCELPSTRPATDAEFAFFQGCLFNLDLYIKKIKYISEEINILMKNDEDKTGESKSEIKRIYVGGVSRNAKFCFPKSQKNFHPKPINCQVELATFLGKILVALIGYLDPELKKAIISRTEIEKGEISRAKGLK